MPPNNNHLFIRTDADSEIGLGHLMRCLALAQCWKKIGGKVTFIARFDSDVLCDRIISEGFDFIRIERSCPDPSDWALTEKVLRKSSGSWLSQNSARSSSFIDGKSIAYRKSGLSGQDIGNVIVIFNIHTVLSFYSSTFIRHAAR